MPIMAYYNSRILITKISRTINLTNPGLISHNEILEMYKEIVDKDLEEFYDRRTECGISCGKKQ